MALGIMMVADVAAGSGAAWSAGVAWNGSKHSGFLFKAICGTTYAASVLCMTFPLLLDLVELYAQDRVGVRPGATLFAIFLMLGTLAPTAVLALWSAAEGDWVWPSWSPGVGRHMRAEGGQHAANLASATGDVAGGTLDIVSNLSPGPEVLFFPDLFSFEFGAELEALAIVLAVVLAILVFVPGAFATGALMAWAMRRRRDAFAR